MIKQFTSANFDTDVSQSAGVYAVRFWAEWCGPCRMVAPVFEAVAAEMQDRVQFGEVDIDRVPELAARFRIQSIPAIVVFKDGKPVDQLTGARGKPELAGFISRHAA